MIINNGIWIEMFIFLKHLLTSKPGYGRIASYGKDSISANLGIGSSFGNSHPCLCFRRSIDFIIHHICIFQHLLRKVGLSSINLLSHSQGSSSGPTGLDSPDGVNPSPILSPDLQVSNGPQNRAIRDAEEHGGTTANKSNAFSASYQTRGTISDLPTISKNRKNEERQIMDPRYRLYQLSPQTQIPIPFDFVQLTPKISYKVEATHPVQVIFCDETNYNLLLGGQVFISQTPAQVPSNLNILHFGEIYLPHGGRWYLVIRNWDFDLTTVFHYDLEVYK